MVERQINMGDTPYIPRIAIEEISSGSIVFLLLYPLLKWLRWVTKNIENSKLQFAYILLAQLPFATLHISGMFLIRSLVFEAQGYNYGFWGVLKNQGFFEYRIDILLFLGLVGVHFVRVKFLGEEPLPKFLTRTKSLLVKTARGETRVNPKDIQYVRVDENYVCLFTGDKEYLHRSSLKNLEEKLPEGKFCRTHRKYMVNISKVQRVESTPHGDFKIYLLGDIEVPLSRRYRKTFKEHFEF